jgi:hypothetical protein
LRVSSEFGLIPGLTLLADVWILIYERAPVKLEDELPLEQLENSVVMLLSDHVYESDLMAAKKFASGIVILEEKLNRIQYDELQESNMIIDGLRRTGSGIYSDMECDLCRMVHVAVYGIGGPDDIQGDVIAFCRKCYLWLLRSSLRNQQNRKRRKNLK